MTVPKPPRSHEPKLSYTILRNFPLAKPKAYGLLAQIEAIFLKNGNQSGSSTARQFDRALRIHKRRIGRKIRPVKPLDIADKMLYCSSIE